KKPAKLGMRGLSGNTRFNVPGNYSDQLLPIGVLARLVGRIGDVVQQVLRIGADARVGRGVLKRLHVLVVVHQSRQAVRALARVAHAGPELRLHAARAGALGRHEDDAVGTAAAVNGSRRRVLQHVDGHDVIHVEVVEAAVDRYAVYHDEWIVPRRDGSHAANPDAGLISGLVARVGDVHAREPVLQRLDRVER